MTHNYVLHMFDDMVLVVRNDGQKIQVRGAPNYATDYQPVDPLHQFLDSLDPPTVSQLFADGKASPNHKNSRANCSFKSLDQLYASNR